MTFDDGGAASDRPSGTKRTPADGWRVRLTGGPDRIIGLDVARGLAVLGMFVAHVGVDEGETWMAVADGRSSILFALVAGISLAVVTGSTTPCTGAARSRARARLLVRSVLLLALVGLLDLLGTPVLLILGFYATYFVLALPFIGWGPRRLAAAAALVALVGPPVAYWVPEVLMRTGFRMPRDGSGALTDFVLTGNYPAVVWMAYVFAGMAIGRCDLTSALVRSRLVIGGLVAMAVGYGTSALLLNALTTTVPAAVAIETRVAETSSWFAPHTWSDPWPPASYLALHGPHDETWFEVIGSGGFAVVVVAACLSAGRVGGTALAPVAAVGALALTAYSLHIVAIWHWDLTGAASNGPLVSLVLITLVACTAWRYLLGRGPIERILTEVAQRTAPPMSSGIGR